MKRNILTVIGLTAFFIVAIFAISLITDSGKTDVYAFPGGSPGGQTNSPTDGSNCTTCHSGTLNAGNGTTGITSNIPAEGYVPGQTYTITGSIGQVSINKFGFEITAERTSDNAKTGTIILTDATRTAFTNSNTSVTHTEAGNSPLTTNATTWSFDWTAPESGTGGVTFYGAFNSVNGSGPNEDQIYAKTLPVSEDILTTITENVDQNVFNIYPNPVKNSFQIASDKPVQSVRVYNLQGKQVSSLARGATKVNVEHLPAGVYFVNVETDGVIKTEKLIKE
jgi:hypothetical protein